MQMMFFYLFILTVFFTTSNVKSIQQNLNFDDDIFYGDPFSLKKLHINKIKDQFSKSIQKPVISKIKNLNDYISNYKNHILKPSDFVVITKEKCLNFYNLKELFLKGNKNIQEIEANLLFISDYLNDLNYLFKDEYGNFLIFSVCKNLFLSSNGNLSNDNDNYIKCFQRFIFISKIDFSIYSFSFSGEKIPSLINFSVDFSIDEFTHKRFLFLFGGIDKKGNHNSDIYKFDIDYSFGNININKITSTDINSAKNTFIPQGVSEASLNIVQYKKDNLNYKKNHISLIFGGNNDENISNKFYAYKHETSTWLTHKINENHSIIPRKGHSAVLTKSNIITIENVNEDVIQIYNLVIFGGKSINTYLNDIVIIKTFYVVLDDRIYFKYLQLENNKEVIGDYPEPREGHKAFIENEILYIYGGCNYSIKKCYFDSVYKLNLKNNPLKWEKEALIVNKLKEDSKLNYFTKEKIKFNNLKNGEKISNILAYKEAFISVGICEVNEDYCKNQFNIVIPHSNCIDDDNNKNKECFLDSENKENKFDWVYRCENKKKKNNLNDNKGNQNNAKFSTKKRLDFENLYLENSMKQENIKKMDDFDNKMNKLIHKNNIDFIFENNKQNINSNLIQIKEKPIDENKFNSPDLNSFFQKSNENYDNSNNILKIQNNLNSQTRLNEMLLTQKILELLNIKKLVQNSKNSDQHPKSFDIKNISQNNVVDFSINIDDKFKSKINQNKTKVNNLKKMKNTTKKQLSKRMKKSRPFNKTDLIKRIENKFSENFTNTTFKLFENLDYKFQDYINKTESSNRLNNLYIKKIMEENLKVIMKENNNLKKIIFNNEIKPYLKNDLFSNYTKQEINFLNFDEKILNVSQQIKKKASDEFKLKTLKELEKNSYLTKYLVKNISEIKNIIDKENKDYKSHFDNLLSNLIKKIEGIDNIIEKKFTRVSNFISNQESINNSTKEYLRKEELRKSKVVKQCFNGFLLNETTCQCLPGFSGEHCQIILICEDDCSKNGVCHYGKCFCNPGFSGEKCEKKEKCPNDCNNRGKCHLGKCYCDYGFSGIECEIKHSCEKNCNNRGLCFRGQCLCEPGFTGEDCSQIAIKFDSCKNNCNKNGVCKMEKCFCYPGFSGKYCEIKHKFSCPSNLDIAVNPKNNTNHSEKKTYIPCNGNGLCKFGMCFCYPGFKGRACENKEICKNNCNNNGICIKGKCHCHNDSNTEDCSEIKKGEVLLNSNSTVNTNQNNLTKMIKNDKRSNDFSDFHFIQIDNEKNTKTDENLNSEIQNAIKIDNSVQNLQSNLNTRNFEDINLKKSHYSIIDEKRGIKYEYNPDGIYVGKETLDKIIYSGMVLISITFSILLTIYLNRKFSK